MSRCSRLRLQSSKALGWARRPGSCFLVICGRSTRTCRRRSAQIRESGATRNGCVVLRLGRKPIEWCWNTSSGKRPLERQRVRRIRLVILLRKGPRILRIRRRIRMLQNRRAGIQCWQWVLVIPGRSAFVGISATMAPVEKEETVLSRTTRSCGRRSWKRRVLEKGAIKTRSRPKGEKARKGKGMVKEREPKREPTVARVPRVRKRKPTNPTSLALSS